MAGRNRKVDGGSEAARAEVRCGPGWPGPCPAPVRKPGWLLCLVVCCLLRAVPAWAQSEAAKSTAREIAKEGLLEFDQGRYEQAWQKLSQAYQVVKVPTIAVYGARALVKLGRLVEAAELYLEATRLEVSGGDIKAQQRAQAEAAQEREALLPRVPRLVLQIEGAEPSAVKVTVDGQVVPEALFGTGHLVNPGTRQVVGQRGTEQVTETVTLGEGETRTVVLRFEGSGAAGPVSAEPGATGGQVAPAVAQPGPEEAASGRWKTWRTVGWAAVAVGGAGVVTGSVMGLLGIGQKSSLQDEGCDSSGHCYTDQRSEIDSYDTKRTVSTIGFAVGAVGLAAGITILFTSGREPERSAMVAPWVGAGAAGVAGRF